MKYCLLDQESPILMSRELRHTLGNLFGNLRGFLSVMVHNQHKCLQRRHLSQSTGVHGLLDS